jgi:hypothetical protein
MRYLVAAHGIQQVQCIKETLHKSRHSCLAAVGGVKSVHLATT